MKSVWLLLQSSTWKLARLGSTAEMKSLSTPLDASPQEVAAAVSQEIKAQGETRAELILAFNGMRFLTATLHHQGGRTRNRVALGYLLEEQLPLSTEEMVCDFIVYRQRAFGVAAETAYLAPWVASLAEEGIALRSITATPLLALQELSAQADCKGSQLLIWPLGEQFHLFELKDRRPLTWRIVSNSVSDVNREVNIALRAHSELKSCMVVDAASFDTSGNAFAGIRCARIELTQDKAAILAASRTVSAGGQPWIQLKREPLGAFDALEPLRRPLRFLAISIFLCLIGLAAALWIRAARYEELGEQRQHEQESLFAELFPGQRVPVGIRARLESEHRKLAGMTGQLQGMPQLNSALEILHRTLSPLPADLRFRLLEVRVEADGVYLEGEVRQHGDADMIVNKLRERLFEVAPPRTERLAEKGVSYVVSAKLPSSARDTSGAKP